MNSEKSVIRSPWQLLIAAIILGLAFFRICSASFDDFAVYWRAGKEALAGISVYTEPGHYQFKYAPFTAWSLGWIHRILFTFGTIFGVTDEGFRPHGAAGGVLVSEGSMWVARFLYWIFLCAWMLWLAQLARRNSPAPLRWKHLGLVLILLLQSLSEELNLGQVNFIPIALLALVLRELDRGNGTKFQTLGCSLALATAVQFKLFSLIVYPLLALRGRWSWILGSAIAILGCNLILPGAIFGFAHAVSEFQAWAITLTHSSDQLLYSGHNISWIGTIGKATGSPVLAKAGWILLVLAFLAGQFRIRRFGSEFQTAWTLAGILILNPLTWNYWMLFLAPLLFQLMARFANDIEHSPRKFSCIFLVLWIPFHLIFSPIPRNWLQPAMILGLTLIWFQKVVPHRVRG